MSALIFMCLDRAFYQIVVVRGGCFVSMAEKVAERNDGDQSSRKGVPKKGPWARATQGVARQA